MQQQKLNQEEEVNLNKVVVITKNDLDRITGHLERRKREKETVVEDQNRMKPQAISLRNLQQFVLTDFSFFI